MKESQKLLLIAFVFVGFYFIPFSSSRVHQALIESFQMAREYAREHVLLCLVPAFFIAGAIANFVSQGAVLKYFGAKANKFLSYTVASVSGSILAVCSCTVLPLFAGIYKRGAGIGPATAFLYSGPAINIMAIILTARVLGPGLGIARAVGAILFAFIIGLLMHFIFIKDEVAKDLSMEIQTGIQKEEKPLGKTAGVIFALTAILVFANWGKSDGRGLANFIYSAKYYLAGFFLLVLGYMIMAWFKKEELAAWVGSTWDLAKQIFPLLFIGVLMAGFMLGRPGHEGIIPMKIVETLVGGNSIKANLLASVAGAFMYFATLTEVPILQGLLGAGMGQGPALAMLLAGPALSLPNMLVIHSVMGMKRTVTYILLVVSMATLSGILFGSLIS
ncbi:MAG: permease [Spirochaetes bacterium]|nr:permease [Spirochaetota bacterium]